MTKSWSQYQQNIFDFVANETGNAIVTAVAGSGKTTTIVEALKLAQGETIFLAFNKSISMELKARGVNARTFHSLTYGPVINDKNQQEPTTDKLFMLAKEHFDKNDFWLYQNFARRMVGLARQAGIGCLEVDTEEAWIDIAEHHDITPDKEAADFSRGIELARYLLQLSNSSPMVDYDDMLYFAVKDGIVLPKFDFVFVDEAQDTNAIQRAILKKIMKPTTRLIAVGDPAQAIYGFRGADSNSLDLIAEEFNCTRLPLSITYRCPTSVVKVAQTWVNHIEAAEGAPEGKVETVDKLNPDDAEPGDLVVCRRTASLIQEAYRFVKANRPVTIMGKDIGESMKGLVKQMATQDVDKLQEKLDSYRIREVEKAMIKGNESKAEAINDKVGAIQFLIGSLREDRRTVEMLNAGIDYLFANRKNAVVFATIHKAKGLEAERVFWLERSACPAKWAKQEWQRQQEINLCYVAATRAKKELYLVG